MVKNSRAMVYYTCRGWYHVPRSCTLLQNRKAGKGEAGGGEADGTIWKFERGRGVGQAKEEKENKAIRILVGFAYDGASGKLMDDRQVQVMSTLPLKALSRLWGRFNELDIPYYLRVPGFKLYSWIFGVKHVLHLIECQC
jgi:hypothetical protein